MHTCRYSQEVESELGPADEETGWKLVHGDVFRYADPPPPRNPCTLVGATTPLVSAHLGHATSCLCGVFAV